MEEITAVEQNKEKRMKRNEDSLRGLWDKFKCTNICIIGVLEGEEREKGPEKIFEEIIVKNFPNTGKEIATQVQEAQRVPGRINPVRNTPRHTVIKLTKIKDKEKILKAAREKEGGERRKLKITCPVLSWGRRKKISHMLGRVFFPFFCFNLFNVKTNI